MIEMVADLKDEVILLDDRFEGWNEQSQCLLTVDGTDCPINEPWPFDGKWYSEKFNGPAIKYEVAVCIQTSHICWVNGPFPASKNDNAIFKDGLATHLADDEAVEADSGYAGDQLKTPTVATSRRERKMKSVARGRHENVNGSLKVFNVLNAPFRHLKPRDKVLKKHGICFTAVAVITQLKFKLCGVAYTVNYDVTYE